MADIAHISGPVAKKQQSCPFEHCDGVTALTRLRSGMCSLKYSHARRQKANRHSGVLRISRRTAAQLLEVMTPECVESSKAAVPNSKILAEALISKGHKLASGGTDKLDRERLKESKNMQHLRSDFQAVSLVYGYPGLSICGGVVPTSLKVRAATLGSRGSPFFLISTAFSSDCFHVEFIMPNLCL